MNEIEITTDKNRLNLLFIHTFISNSYWGKDRTIEAMQMCINHSLNFGVYTEDKQIGYARVVTDYAQFAYIMELFIDEAYRRRGYSKKFIQYLLDYEALRRVRVWRLATTDAHDLYKKFGFKVLENPEKLMEMIK